MRTINLKIMFNDSNIAFVIEKDSDLDKNLALLSEFVVALEMLKKNQIEKILNLYSIKSDESFKQER